MIEFKAKEHKELYNIKLRKNTEGKFLNRTTVKSGSNKGQSLSYFIIELEPVKKNKNLLIATTKNIVYTASEFNGKLYNAVLAGIKSGMFDKETGETEFQLEGNHYEEPTGFKYIATMKDGREVTMTSVNFVTIMDESPYKAYERAVKLARETIIEEADTEGDAFASIPENKEATGAFVKPAAQPATPAEDDI